MKLSEKMYERALPLWEEACEKPFVTGMAKGTLLHEQFQKYMVQDALYLFDYLEILNECAKLTEDAALLSFLRGVIEETRQELEDVHIPNLKAAGIEPEEIEKEKRINAVLEYVSFMKKILKEEGLFAGLTALLQCCWVYSFIGERVSKKYAPELSASPYKSWFDCYTGEEYNAAKQRWIEEVDRLTEGLLEERKGALCRCFVTCAAYENRLWDALYEL